MPRIYSFFGIIIWIYWDDHNPPHFHAEYNDDEILIVINDLTFYTGSLPSRANGLVMEWASQHQQELKTNWELAAQGLPLNKIEPLK